MRPTHAASLLVAVALIAVAFALGLASPGSSTPSVPDRAAAPPRVTVDAAGGALGEDDGAVPDGATVFDGALPGVARIDPALLGALRRAATEAASDDGIAFAVDSGWRSARYQERLLQEAIAKYGSATEAARWVARPDASAHVSGDAIDLGRAAAAWLADHGAAYGLCRVYGNEPWHYELRPEAAARGCPATYADAAHDPRMQR